MELLQIKDLSFSYPEEERKALDGVSLSIREGEFIVLCGESGCGKSTLLKLLKRELSPYGKRTGEICYRGKPLSETEDRIAASEIGFVQQNPESQIVTDTVWHELAFGLENLGLDTQTIRRRVAEMAGYFGIEGWFHRKTTELSGGQKQLLNLAAVMAMQPKVLLLDEPTAQLDPIAASNFIGTLQKLNRELGLTVLLVEHRLEEVFPVADRVLLLDHGHLMYQESPRKIVDFWREHPDHPVLAGLPAAMRIFRLLNGEENAPITVREGRNYITEKYQNQINCLPIRPYSHREEKALELKEVWFRYERELPDVLKGVSIAVYQGEHFCFLGGNGAGKTTLLGVMAGVLKPYRGNVLISGKKRKDYTEKELYQNQITLLPQDPQTVFLEKTLEEDWKEVCRTLQNSPAETTEKIRDIAEKLHLTHLLGMHPYDLSGGEQQKAALGKMLLLQPKILLLDEPTKGIDANAKQTLSEILRELKAEGITIITVTHDVEFAAANGDRCGMFFDGETVSVGTPTVFFSENSFYTTAANRISRGYYQNAVLCEEVAVLCTQNGRREGKTNV